MAIAADPQPGRATEQRKFRAGLLGLSISY
jgi:hypothetical protein